MYCENSGGGTLYWMVQCPVLRDHVQTSIVIEVNSEMPVVRTQTVLRSFSALSHPIRNIILADFAVSIEHFLTNKWVGGELHANCTVEYDLRMVLRGIRLIVEKQNQFSKNKPNPWTLIAVGSGKRQCGCHS
jgi:hypothetical protein